MKYSIHVKEGWINYYNRKNHAYSISINRQERIRCSYELASAIFYQLKNRGLCATLEAELVLEKRNRSNADEA